MIWAGISELLVVNLLNIMSNRSPAVAFLLKDTHPKPETSIHSSDVLPVVVNHFENLNANNVEIQSIHLLSLENTYKVNGQVKQVQTFSAISVRKISEKKWILTDTIP